MSKKEYDKQGENEGGEEEGTFQKVRTAWPEVPYWRQFYPDTILVSSS